MQHAGIVEMHGKSLKITAGATEEGDVFMTLSDPKTAHVVVEFDCHVCQPELEETKRFGKKPEPAWAAPPKPAPAPEDDIEPQAEEEESVVIKFSPAALAEAEAAGVKIGDVTARHPERGLTAYDVRRHIAAAAGKE